MTSLEKVFERVVANALEMPEDNQAINFACTQLECMYLFTSCPEEVKAMCSHAAKNFYHEKRFRGNDHVLRIFQVLIRVSQQLGASGIYDQIERGGYFKNSLKFHILWAEAEAAAKNQKRFKEIWTLARERLPSRSIVDSSFRDIASVEFPDISSWFEDDDHERTLNLFAPTKNRRRSSVAFLERAAIPSVPLPSLPSTKAPQFMSKKNPMRTVLMDREDGYLGISMEEYRLAKMEALADMEITTMQPTEEEPEMEIKREETVEAKKMTVNSPIRQPLHPKQETKAPSPLVAPSSSFNGSIVAGNVEGGRGAPFASSTPQIGGEAVEENFWMERRGSEGGSELDSLDLSAIGNGGEEEKSAPPPVPSSTASAFAGNRKSFGGGVVGDKARSSIGTKGGAPNQEIDNALLSKEMNCMQIGGVEKINPWDREIRRSIMNACSIPVNRHDLKGMIKQPTIGYDMELGGEVYSLDKLIGEGGFAKVFLCENEKKELLAIKYENPACEWEVYILEALRKRVRNDAVMESLMQVTDAFIYENCSLILSEYLPMGTLLQSTDTNTDPHWSIVVYLGMQMAKVLKDVHAANIVHGDAKPDNWMVIEKINEDASIDELMEARNLRLIDWGRAIDMKALGGRSLYGKAGTENFDCIEMREERPWTYHPDYYAFCATIYVLHMKEYMTVAPSLNGRYAPVRMLKRRVTTLALWTEIFDECFNVPEGGSLPSWSLIHEKLKGYLIENMDRSAWKEAVKKFNKSLKDH